MSSIFRVSGSLGGKVVALDCVPDGRICQRSFDVFATFVGERQPYAFHVALLVVKRSRVARSDGPEDKWPSDLFDCYLETALHAFMAALLRPAQEIRSWKAR